MSARGIFALIAVVSISTGVTFLALGESRGVAIPWLLVGIMAAVGVVLADRRRRR